MVRDAFRCGRPGVHRWGGGSIGSDSGRRLRAGCRARMLGWWSGSRRRSARGGSARMAGCRQAIWPCCRGAICRSPNEKRSRSCTLRASGGIREIARRLGRCPSTTSRELRRNAATRGGDLQYRATTAQWHADRRARRLKVVKLAANNKLRQYVQDGLAGVINGTSVPGPDVRWIGRRHGRRQERRWARSWSPEQIAHRLRVDFPEDDSMRISHEAIYQALYVQGRGALRRELVACSVAPAETRRPGQTAPPAEGLSCNNATSRRPPLLVMFAVSSAPTAGGGLPPHPRPRGARTHVRTRTSPPPSLSRTGCRAAPGDPP